MYTLLTLTFSTAPEGFALGKLKLHHAELVAGNWIYHDDYPNKLPYFKALISNFKSRALFAVDDPETPVSWILEEPNGEFGIAFTMEEYRGRRLFHTVHNNLICATVGSGDFTPFLVFSKGAPKPQTIRGGIVPFNCIWKYMSLVV